MEGAAMETIAQFSRGKALRRRVLLVSAVVLAVLPCVGRASNPQTGFETSEGWSVGADFGDYSNAGWEISGGVVRTSYRWFPPHAGDMAAWFEEVEGGNQGDVRLTSPPLPYGARSISFWAYNSRTEGTNTFEIQYLSTASNWVTSAWLTTSFMHSGWAIILTSGYCSRYRSTCSGRNI